MSVPEVTSTLCAGSAFRHGGFSLLLGSPPHGHQHGPSPGFCLDSRTFGVYWPGRTLQSCYAPGPMEDCLPPVRPCPASPNVLLNLSPCLLHCCLPSPIFLQSTLPTLSSLFCHSSPCYPLAHQPCHGHQDTRNKLLFIFCLFTESFPTLFLHFTSLDHIFKLMALLCNIM